MCKHSQHNIGIVEGRIHDARALFVLISNHLAHDVILISAHFTMIRGHGVAALQLRGALDPFESECDACERVAGVSNHDGWTILKC